MTEPRYSDATEQWWQRIPAIYRREDAKQDWAMKALISSLGDRLETVAALVDRFRYVPPSDQLGPPFRLPSGDDHFSTLDTTDVYPDGASPVIWTKPTAPATNFYLSRSADNEYVQWVQYLKGGTYQIFFNYTVMSNTVGGVASLYIDEQLVRTYDLRNGGAVGDTVQSPVYQFDIDRGYISFKVQYDTEQQIDYVYVSSTGLPKASTLTDPFTGTVAASIWQTSSPGVTQTGDRLSITAASTYPHRVTVPTDATDCAVALRVLQVATGPNDVSTYAVRSTSGTGNQLHIYFMNGNLFFANETNFVDAGQISVTYSATNHLFWRFRHNSTANAVYMETSADGLTWTTQRTISPAPSYMNSAQFVIESYEPSTAVTYSGSSTMIVLSTLLGGAVVTSGTVAMASQSALAGAATLMSGSTSGIGTNAPPTGGNVTVDFRTVITAMDPLGIGITLSTYNGGGSASINTNASWKAKLQSLAPGHCRVPLRWAGGNPGSAAAYAQTSGDAVTYISNIKSIGAIPFVVFGGNTTDNNMTAADGAAFVNYLNKSSGGGYATAGPVKYWVVGNEPDSNGVQAAYLSALPGILSAMHAADPTIKISAPACGSGFNTDLMISASHDNVDILSYHAYDGSNFPSTIAYRDNMATARGYKAGILYGCEEVNWFYDYLDSPSPSGFYDWRNACFIASAAGQTVAGGGHFTQYADSNGPLGLMNDGDSSNSSSSSQPGSFLTTFPAYWGVGIWTGMNGQFKRYSSNMVSATTTLGASVVDVFACDNGKIVAVNKTTTARAMTINMGGKVSGTYNVWATSYASPLTAITKLVNTAAYSASTITYTIPAGTAVSIDVS